MIPLKSLIVNLFVVLSIFIPQYAHCQQKPSYNMQFAGAKWIDLPLGNDILVVLEVTPNDLKDWAPVVSEKIAYKIDEQNEIVTRIGEKSHIGVVLCDKNVKERQPDVYGLVKDKLANSQLDKVLFIAFYFHQVTFKKPEKMTLTYGLWEKNNLDLRVEQKFEFAFD